MATASRSVLVIHGPNLNLLGAREPEIYGSLTLAEIDERLRSEGASLGLDVECAQSNHEGALIEWVQNARTARGGLILNPGGYSHTSVALADAIRACQLPAVEVHLSNLYARESFRHTSITGSACLGVISGLGHSGYVLALRHLAGLLGED